MTRDHMTMLKNTLRAPIIHADVALAPNSEEFAFQIDNSETEQRNKEKKLLQHDRKNGGNTTIQRQRSRKEPLEFDQRLYPD